jgi:alkylation response protein AidB-like acyl-CoA dehydrogenase/predicted heme/steroid binding protein
MSATYTLEEVSQHSSENDCWIVVDNVVYDVTKFLKSHPGGKGIILKLAGRDCTSEFYDFHARDVLEKYGPKLRKGGVKNASSPVFMPSSDDRLRFDTYTPFAESPAFRGWKSPYFTEKHRKVKLAVREFLHKTLLPICESCEDLNEDPPHESYLAMGAAGMIATRMGPSAAPFVEAMGMKLPAGLKPSELDYFTRYVANYEFYMNLPPGLSDGVSAGISIGLPPIMYFGNDEQKQRYIPKLLSGELRVALAVTEASGGSDVAGIKGTAKLSADGSHYIVNAQKRWITCGTAAEVFVTALRTGQPGHKGLSFLIIDRSEGLTTSKMKTSYSGAASTAVVIYENVRVPKENLLGPENEAFKLIMANFLSERWIIVHSFLGPMRKVIADCYRWAMQRKAFGKRLIDQPVIRYKLAEMSAAIEALDAWCESITYQMDKMSFMEQASKLAAPVALLKFHTTRTAVMVADNACQIFGGRAVTRTGMGKHIEAFQRSYKIPAIYGGSEEIMADLAVKQEVARLDARLAKKDPKAIAMSRL